LRGTRNLLGQNSFWLRRPDLNLGLEGHCRRKAIHSHGSSKSQVSSSLRENSSASQPRTQEAGMQQGSLIRSARKRGPDVWQFRWADSGPQGKRIYRKRVNRQRLFFLPEQVPASIASRSEKR
jgi:hypothetical protein